MLDFFSQTFVDLSTLLHSKGHHLNMTSSILEGSTQTSIKPSVISGSLVLQVWTFSSRFACWTPADFSSPSSLHGVGKSRTGLSDFTFTFHFHALEKEMATHSSVLAWRIPGTGEPAGLPSMGSHRVGHDWSDLAAAAGEIPGRFLAQPCLKALFHPFFQSAFNSERMDPVRGNLMGKELMLMLHGNYLPS